MKEVIMVALAIVLVCIAIVALFITACLVMGTAQSMIRHSRISKRRKSKGDENKWQK